MKWLINLLTPQKYADMLATAQAKTNGYKTYLGLAIVFINQCLVPFLLQVAVPALTVLGGLCNEFTALHGLGEFIFWARDLSNNPAVVKLLSLLQSDMTLYSGGTLAAAGLANKVDKNTASVLAVGPVTIDPGVRGISADNVPCAAPGVPVSGITLPPK